ncbi:MAG: CAP domain-containing protein [Bryobacteraceae bacterium]|jgi:uncharacterized protein YkwD
MTRRALLQSAFAASVGPGADPADLHQEARRIFERINELRTLRLAPALQWSEALAVCAREQCERKRLLRFPGHDDPQRGGVADRLNAAGIGWAKCAENLFTMKGYDDPVNFAVVFWWYSAGHQANILDPAYTHTGVGAIEGADGTYFVAQIFVEARLSR